MKADDVKGTSQQFYLYGNSPVTEQNIAIRPSHEGKELTIWANSNEKGSFYEKYNNYVPGSGWHEVELLWRHNALQWIFDGKIIRE